MMTTTNYTPLAYSRQEEIERLRRARLLLRSRMSSRFLHGTMPVAWWLADSAGSVALVVGGIMKVKVALVGIVLLAILIVGGVVWNAEREPETAPRISNETPRPESDASAPASSTAQDAIETEGVDGSGQRKGSDSSRMHQVLASTKVQDLHWQAGDITLGGAVQYLRAVTGLNFVLSRKVRETRSDTEIELRLNDVSVRQMLELITQPNEMVWNVRHGVVLIETTEEAATPRVRRSRGKPATDEEKRFRTKLLERTVDLPFDGTRFQLVLDFLKAASGIDFVIDPGAKEALEGCEVRLLASSLTVHDALEIILGLTHPDGEVVYEIEGSAVIFKISGDGARPPR
jgi:hypothetical protein